MHTTINDLVEEVRNLSLSEKIEVKSILKKSIISEKRKNILNNFLNSEKEDKENKLTF